MIELARRGWLVVCLGTIACGGQGAAPTVPAPAAPVAPPAPSARPTAVDAAPATRTAPAKAAYAPPLLATPLAGDPTKTTIHRLSNGMTIYLSPDPQVPSVVAHIVVRAGGAADPRDSTGLAHYLEHMMLFKGTSQLGTTDFAKERPHLDRIAELYAQLRAPGADREQVFAAIDAETQAAAAYEVPNEVDQLFQQIGVTNFDAYTGYDATVLFAEIPRNRLRQWARIEGQRFGDPVFRLFWPELEVVYEEKNLGMDSPPRRVHEAYMRAMFPSWTSVLGEIEHLKTPAYRDMVAFFTRYYAPSNMAILLAGDVDASVLPILEDELGRIRRAPGDAAPPPARPHLAGRTEVTVQVPEDGVVLGWPLVPASHPDRLALEAMDLLMLDGRFGLLSRELLTTQRVARAESNVDFRRDNGDFQLAADALAGQSHAEVERLLLGLVEKLQRGEFTDDDLTAAILSAELQEQRRLESNEGRVDRMEEAFVTGTDWASVATRIVRMKQLTRADIIRVATQYLGSSFVAVYKRKGEAAPPKIAKPHITPVTLDPGRQSVLAKAILAMPATSIEPVAVAEGKDFQRAALPTGELIAVPNRRNGLFELKFSYAYGRADDRLACLALDLLKVSGAGKRSAAEVERELHGLGLVLDTTCSPDEIEISLSGLDRNLEAGMAVLRDLLTAPAIAEATLQARVATELTERANQLTAPETIADALRQRAQHGADSKYLVVASNRQLKDATPAQLTGLLARLFGLRHRTAYFGPRSPKGGLAAFTLGDGKLAARPPRPVRYETRSAVVTTALDTAQTQLRLAWPRGPIAGEADRAACALASAYVGYIGKLLFQEVREARGLAYIVYGYCDPGDRKADGASLHAYAGTQRDKVHDTLDAMLAALRRPIDDARLARAREALAQEHRVTRIPPREVAAAVYAWQDQGEPADPRDARARHIAALDKPAIARWLTAAIARPMIVSIAGDRASLDAAKLRALGPVTWLPVSALFGY